MQCPICRIDYTKSIGDMIKLTEQEIQEMKEKEKKNEEDARERY